MITSRRITLHRIPDLLTFRALLTEWLAALSPEQARDACVVVPTHAAAEQLRRTMEERVLSKERAAVVWPDFSTRRDLYDALAARLSDPPSMLSPCEREILLAAVARTTIATGIELPYELRPGLVAELIAFYDRLRRLGRTVDDFERNFRGELEPEQDTDRGARRLLQQTTFLAASYRAYEERLRLLQQYDEHGLRELLISRHAARPLQRIIVTVGDRVVEPEGLWPADFDLLARIPGLGTIDVVATEAVLASGYVERLLGAFPDLGEARHATFSAVLPTLVTPQDGQPPQSLCFSYRDREEELIGVARRLKQQRREGTASPLHRTALIVQRPLPYLYLARDVFRDAGIPFEALDTLPLAAEPYAAAVDLVLDTVAADFTRAALLALLRSPHFDFVPRRLSQAGSRDAAEVSPAEWSAAIRALSRALSDARYLGGLDRLEMLAASWSSGASPATREERRRLEALPALRAIVEAVVPLSPLATKQPMVRQLDLVIEWLDRYDQPIHDHSVRSRRLRVRAAVLGALHALRHAYARQDPEAEGDVILLTVTLRRWLEAQTFATHHGEPGLQLIEARAARYGDFDDVQLLGLVDGEWPERVRRNVLYPSSLLALLEPPPGVNDATTGERDALQSARAAFRDLIVAPAARVRLSTFTLENDAVVEPSMLIDEVASMRMPVIRDQQPSARVMWSEALALAPQRVDAVPPEPAAWAAMRAAADARHGDMLRGEAGPWQMPRVSVSRLETFLNCPFKYFAAHVLRLEEEPEDQPMQTPLERGRFLHDLWEKFFAEWQRRGGGRIDADRLTEARTLFTEICEAALVNLSPVEAALERHKLLGSAISPGIAHRVLAMEATRRVRVEERLLEFPLEGRFEFRTRAGEPRMIPINAKSDRIDVLEGRRLRVIDYKSKNTPDPKLALQLPIYAHLAREILQKSRGGYWSLEEAMYVSFEGDRAVVPLKAAKGESLDTLIADAQERVIDALERIAEGHFPPQPAKKSLCGPCGYRTVCRLEYVPLEGGEGTEGAEGGIEGSEGLGANGQ